MPKIRWTLDSLLIVDLGGTTLDISQVMGKMRGISRIYGDSTLGVSLMTGAVRDALSLARTKGSSYLADDIIIHKNARLRHPHRRREGICLR